jgi:hypothetical protein
MVFLGVNVMNKIILSSVLLLSSASVMAQSVLNTMTQSVENSVENSAKQAAINALPAPVQQVVEEVSTVTSLTNQVTNAPAALAPVADPNINSNAVGTALNLLQK